MVTAKFYMVGESSLWYKVRVQEEITSQGLEGSVIDAGDGRLAVVVEGEGNRIKKLHKSLGEGSPEGVVLTDMSIKHVQENVSGSSEMLELLRKIEKNTRRISKKLDALLDSRPGLGTEDPETEEPPEGVAESSFAAMFGGE